MEYNIRQLSFGEVLDRSLRILIDNPVLLIGIGLVLGLPAAALQRPGMVFLVVNMVFVLLAAPLVVAALNSAIADTYLNRPTSIVSAYRAAWSIILPFVGTYLLVYLIVGLIAGGVVGFGWVAARGSGSLGALILVGFIAFAIAVYLGNRWSLIIPIMIVERRYGMRALSRSSELVAGVWWRTLGIALVAGLLVRFPLSVLQLFWGSIPVLGTILTGLVSSIATVYTAIAILVYYFDRRCRVEDFDLRRLAEQIRAESAPGSAAMAGAPSV